MSSFILKIVTFREGCSDERGYAQIGGMYSGHYHVHLFSAPYYCSSCSHER